MTAKERSCRVGRRVRGSGCGLIEPELFGLGEGCRAHTTWLPTDRTLYRGYKAAEACPARTPIPNSEDCLRKIAFIWRGVVVVVAAGDVRRSSADVPRDEPQTTAAVGTSAWLPTALALMYGACTGADGTTPVPTSLCCGGGASQRTVTLKTGEAVVPLMMRRSFLPFSPSLTPSE